MLEQKCKKHWITFTNTYAGTVVLEQSEQFEICSDIPSYGLRTATATSTVPLSHSLTSVTDTDWQWQWQCHPLSLTVHPLSLTVPSTVADSDEWRCHRHSVSVKLSRHWHWLSQCQWLLSLIGTALVPAPGTITGSAPNTVSVSVFIIFFVLLSKLILKGIAKNLVVRHSMWCLNNFQQLRLSVWILCILMLLTTFLVAIVVDLQYAPILREAARRDSTMRVWPPLAWRRPWRCTGCYGAAVAGGWAAAAVAGGWTSSSGCCARRVVRTPPWRWPPRPTAGWWSVEGG